MITIRNNFHHTKYRTHKTAKEIRDILNTHPADWSVPTLQWVNQVWHTLCGTQGCTCGGVLGERGYQEYDFTKGREND